jgi:transcriptional regulator with XRE-family HTH domain
MKTNNDQQGGVAPLKELRERLGDSQQQLANRLGTSITSISRWERGSRSMLLSIPQMLALVKAIRSVGWDVEEFLSRASEFEAEENQSADSAPNTTSALDDLLN